MVHTATITIAQWHAVTIGVYQSVPCFEISFANLPEISRKPSISKMENLQEDLVSRNS